MDVLVSLPTPEATPQQIPNKRQHARPDHSTYQFQACMSMSGAVMVEGRGVTYSNGCSDTPQM